ncbi:MAG: hypothetical protein JWO86_4893 [Myxococcaceae bacterium]|nr:hypothetical protein [Myxococcaceae bacterium]
MAPSQDRAAAAGVNTRFTVIARFLPSRLYSLGSIRATKVAFRETPAFFVAGVRGPRVVETRERYRTSLRGRVERQRSAMMPKPARRWRIDPISSLGMPETSTMAATLILPSTSESTNASR